MVSCSMSFTCNIVGKCCTKSMKCCNCDIILTVCGIFTSNARCSRIVSPGWVLSPSPRWFSLKVTCGKKPEVLLMDGHDKLDVTAEVGLLVEPVLIAMAFPKLT